MYDYSGFQWVHSVIDVCWLDTTFQDVSHYWTSSVKNLWKLCEKFLAYFIVYSWDATHEYPQKTLISKGHENRKPMKYLWKGAKYNQWNYHERPMKLMAWTRSMKKQWNLFPSNDLWKSCENYCRPTSPIKKPWKLLPSNYPVKKPWKCSHLKEPWKYYETPKTTPKGI